MDDILDRALEDLSVYAERSADGIKRMGTDIVEGFEETASNLVNGIMNMPDAIANMSKADKAYLVASIALPGSGLAETNKIIPALYSGDLSEAALITLGAVGDMAASATYGTSEALKIPRGIQKTARLMHLRKAEELAKQGAHRAWPDGPPQPRPTEAKLYHGSKEGDTDLDKTGFSEHTDWPIGYHGELGVKGLSTSQDPLVSLFSFAANEGHNLHNFSDEMLKKYLTRALKDTTYVVDTYKGSPIYIKDIHNLSAKEYDLLREATQGSGFREHDLAARLEDDYLSRGKPTKLPETLDHKEAEIHLTDSQDIKVRKLNDKEFEALYNASKASLDYTRRLSRLDKTLEKKGAHEAYKEFRSIAKGILDLQSKTRSQSNRATINRFLSFQMSDNIGTLRAIQEGVGGQRADALENVIQTIGRRDMRRSSVLYDDLAKDMSAGKYEVLADDATDVFYEQHLKETLGSDYRDDDIIDTVRNSVEAPVDDLEQTGSYVDTIMSEMKGGTRGEKKVRGEKLLPYTEQEWEQPLKGYSRAVDALHEGGLVK